MSGLVLSVDREVEDRVVPEPTGTLPVSPSDLVLQVESAGERIDGFTQVRVAVVGRFTDLCRKLATALIEVATSSTLVIRTRNTRF